MRVAVKDIPSHPVELAASLSAKDFDVEGHIIKCVSPVEVKATLERITNVLNVTAHAKTRLSFVCSRCAEPFEKDLEETIALSYEIEPTTTHIDLGEDIRQEILIDFPIKILCREECKGICLSCKANLNLEQCKCNKKD